MNSIHFWRTMFFVSLITLVMNIAFVIYKLIQERNLPTCVLRDP